MAKAKKAKAKSTGDPLAPVKKNAFWIALGLILIVGLVCYFLGSGKVSAERTANLNKIKALSTEVASAVPKDALADKGREKFVDDRLKPTRTQVEQTWKSLYDAQSTVFDWPSQVLGDSGEVLQRGLPSNFNDAVKAMPPIEQLTPKHALDSSLSNTYRNFSRGLVDDLCIVLKATNFLGSNTLVTTSGTATTAAKAADKQGEETLAAGDSVLWAKRSQEATREDHFNFKESEPPLVDILHAQEDFWVYETLFRAIAATNDPDGALGKEVQANLKTATKADPKTAPKTPADKAAKADPKTDKKPDPKASAKEAAAKRLEPVIKKVLDVRIGDRYVPPKGEVEVKKTEKVDDGTGAQGEAAAEEKLTTIWLQEAQKRYVNENDEPLKVAEVNALKDGQMEYKRMPVHLRLEMDQRAIGDFFVACMQSPVKIEWRQLTVTADPQYQRSKPIAADAAATSQQTKENTEKKGFFDSTLDLYGVVYIIYPPKLPATEPAAAEVAAEEQPVDAAAKPADAAKTNPDTAKATQ